MEGVANSLNPGNAGDGVFLAEVAELGDFAGVGVPHVHTRAETDTEDVGAAPVHEVEVKVVGELGGVQNFVRDFAYSPGLLPRGEEHLLTVEPDGGEGVDLGAGI